MLHDLVWWLDVLVGLMPGALSIRRVRVDEPGAAGIGWSVQGGVVMAFSVNSPAFADGQTVPSEFTCDGNDAPPAITVMDLPQGTKSFAVIMDDPDAPKGTFTHWLAYDIPAGGNAITATAGKTLANDFGKKGYGGRVHRQDMAGIAITSMSTPSMCPRLMFEATRGTTWRPRSRATPWHQRA